VLVVDDASTDATAALSRRAGAEVVTNAFNLGVGGAMRVGFRYDKAHGYRAVAQLDGDGQHDPRDLPRAVAPLKDVPEPMVGPAATLDTGV
jgi:glycosyltransferase involved in cell wall biosynthesis